MKRSGEPENGGGTVPAADSKFNALILKAARWLFRFALIMCAALLIRGGTAAGITNPVAWPLLTGGVFLLLSEVIFIWFKFLEKK